MPPPSAAALPPVLGIGADTDPQEKYLAYAGRENAHLGSARWKDSGKALEFVEFSPVQSPLVSLSL